MAFDSIGEIIASRMLHIIDENGNQRPVSVFIGKPQPLTDSQVTNVHIKSSASEARKPTLDTAATRFRL